MFIPVGYAQANYRFAGAGLPYGAEFTLGVDVDAYAGTPSTLAAELVADYVATAIETHYSASITFTGVLVKYGPNETGATGEATASAVGTGPVGASPNVSYLVQKLTASGGRRGRGRLFHPGVSEASVDPAGVILASTVIGLNTAFAAMHAAAIADARPFVLLHSSTEHFPDAITSFNASNLAATQRRRMRR